MKMLLLAVLALATPFAAPIASAADAAPVGHAAMDCCNTTCPVCDMPVDKSIHSVPFKPSDAVMKKHAGIDTAMVGFCSEKCHMAYEKEPAKYEDKIVPQWQKSKNAHVKGG